LLQRLAEYLDSFAACFKRPAQRDAARRYVKGLLSDAKRKNMEQIWGRITDPGEYQAIQHFITHSTWSADRLWTALRTKPPDRKGVLIVDDTGIPKAGRHSVGVARQYSGTLGKVGNCQVIVSTVMRSGRSTWPIAMDLYLPEEWAVNAERRAGVGVPKSIRFRKKWEIALEQIDVALAADLECEAVVADAGYGDSGDFRKGLAQRHLAFVVAIQSSVQAFGKPPRFVVPPQAGKGRPRTRAVLAKNSPKPQTVKAIAKSLPNSSWKKVSWRKGSRGWLRAEFAALRVTPSEGWKEGKRHEECWLLCEREIGSKEPAKFYLSNLPKTTARKRLVSLAHTRWAVEQNYEQLKDEVALDHFEGRSWSGLNHHLVLTALTFTFLELERRRSRSQQLPTLNEMRRVVTEIVTIQLFASRERLSRMIVDFIHDPPDF
jgi:SRSO17 transposase